ncbi:MAG: IclR family transcriptional regulator [Porticoccaceae bacterium]|nr:IclR family transcriptional regulator [Porticoccaceae bacterium]
MAKDEKNCDNEAHKQGIQVIARAAAITRALSRSPQGMSLAAIAQEVNLPRSTVQRIVNALQDEYIVEPIGPGGGFRLGPAIGRLLYQTQTDIISVVHPHLLNLCEQFQESSYLTCQAGKETNIIDRVIAEQAVRIVFPVGCSTPLYSTAPGKALLANMELEEVMQLLPSPLPRETVNTLTLDELLQDLEKIRRTGIAADYEEQTLGVCAFAVAINTYMGIFAVGIVLPVSRLIDRTQAICDALLGCKNNIEVRIGAENACKHPPKH